MNKNEPVLSDSIDFRIFNKTQLRIILLIFFCVLNYKYCFLQTKKVDNSIELNDCIKLFNSGDFESAILCFKKRSSIKSKNTNDENLISNLYLIKCQENLGNKDEALILYRKTLPLIIENSSISENYFMTFVDNYATTLYKVGEYAQAIKLIDSYINNLNKDNQFELYSGFVNIISKCFLEKKEYNKVVLICEDFIDFCESKAKTNCNAYRNCIESLALANLYLGNEGLAIELCQKIKNEVVISNGELSLEFVKSNLIYAFILLETNNFQLALEMNQKSAEILKSINCNDRQLVFNVLNNLGMSYISLGDYNSAQTIFIELLNNDFIKKSKTAYFTALNNLAFCYHLKGDFYKANEFYSILIHQLKNEKNSVKIKFTSAVSNYALSENSIGSVNNSIKKLQKNITFCKRNGLAFEQLISIHNLCYILYQNGYYRQAVKSHLDFLKLNAEQKISLRNKYLELENYNNYLFVEIGLKKYDFADQIYSDLIAKRFQYQVENVFGLSEHENKKYEKLFFDEILNYINYKIYRLSDSNKTSIINSINSLLNYKSLSINIQREIQQELASKNDETLTKQFQEWKSKKQQIAKSYELTPDELKERSINLEEKENEANLLEQQLSKQLKSFADKDRTFRWEDIQEKLHEDEVFVEMLRLPVFDFEKMQRTDSVTYVAYIINKECSEPEIVLLKNGRELEGDLFQDYYTNTTNRHSETAVLTGNSYEHFWKEIQTRIGTKKKVFIALDGVFNKINLNTLYNPDEKKYLLETLDINYVTSTIDFIKKPRNPEANLITWKDAVLFGNPNFNQTVSTIEKNNELSFQTSRDIPSFWMDSLTRGMVVKDLPQTKVEIENISKILEKRKINVISFLENDATEENIKNVTSPSILHIATHGYFFEDDLHSDFEEEKYFGLERKQFNMNPMLRSGILLAGANETIKNNAKSTGENGILTSLEASYLNLEQTELVVLSACETGLGKIQNGVGVYGLRKSMKDAGAKNVIMSLWKVDDKVTQEFMTLFYTKLTSGQTIKRAFTKTQLEMKEKYPQPYFWGAFILSEN